MEMLRNLFQRNADMELSIREMENLLGAALIPVEPSRVFLADLKAQLFRRKITPRDNSIWGRMQDKLLLVGGVVGSIVVLISSIKAFINVLQLVAEGIRGIAKGRSKSKIAQSA